MTLLKGIKYFLLLAAATVVPSGCVNSDEECPATPAVDPNSPVTVSLTLTTTQGRGARTHASRAEGDPLEAATDAECRIDLDKKDYMIMVFDTSTRRLLQVLDANYIRNITQADGSKKCLLEATLNAPYSDFTIVTLANWESLGVKYVDFNVTPGLTRIDDLLAKAQQELPFTLATNGWRPFDGTTTGGIPMFGMKAYSVTPDQWAASSDQNPLRLTGEVPMLRALAKIEIVDRINPGQDPRAEITKATLSRYNARGCGMPDITANPGWADENIGVLTPTLPTDAGYSVSATLPLFRDTDITIDGKQYPRYTTYVTEYSSGQYAVADRRPFITLTITNPQTEFGTYAPELTRELRLGTYTDGQLAKELDGLLRNHIYRFEINNITSTIVNMYYTICPWDEANITLPDIPEN